MTFGNFGKVGNRFSADDERFLSSVKTRLSKKGHRADLHLADSFVDEGRQFIEIGYHPNVGKPSEVEIRAFTEVYFPQMKIDWGTLKTAENRIQISLISNSERIPVEDFSKIPPAFEAIGTGIYKDASSGSVWNLEKSGDGLVLIRQKEEVLPEDLKNFEDVRIGDRVLTPLGHGEVVDKAARNVTVKFAQGDVREFAPRDIKAFYNQNQEKAYLKDYYSKAYGIKDFADDLVKDYGRAR